MSTRGKQDTILVFRSGLIGDTLVAIPALSLLRFNEKQSVINLISVIKHRKHVTPKKILDNSGLIDNFFELRIYSYKIIKDIFKLCSFLVGKRIKVVYHLESPDYSYKSKKIFFRIFGVQNFIHNPESFNDKLSEYLLRTIKLYPSYNEKSKDSDRVIINYSTEEINYVSNWLNCNVVPTHRSRLVAFGINANFKSKVWDVENYLYIAKKLVAQYGYIPVLFGGAADSDLHNSFIEKLGVGYNLAGHFTVRQSMYFMRYMHLYIGNDTGVMHMAALEGKKCFSIFSSFDLPNKWLPFGLNHKVYRSEISCSGCLLRVCVERNNLCLRMIQKEEVYEDIRFFLNAKEQHGRE